VHETRKFGSAANEDATEAVRHVTPRNKPHVRASQPKPDCLHVWTRTLLLVAIALVMCAATMLALQIAGPDVAALYAGEGSLITD